MFSINSELCLLEKYKLTPTELFLTKVILLAQIEKEYEWLQRFAKIQKLRPILESLQQKEIILKSWKFPKEGTKVQIEDIPFNKNFLKQFFRSSYELGEELFNAYPQFITIQGVSYNARRVSKKFNDIEDAFAKYGKAIKYSDELHQQIIDNIRWGIDNGYNFTTLDDFIADRAWTALEAFRKGEGTNINTEAVQLI